MALAGFTQTAFSQLPPVPLNFTGDPLQTSMALVGLLGNLSSWSLRIANGMNLLIPNGGPVPVSQGGTGATTFTAHGVLIGEGTSPIVATAAGASGIPLIGQGAADPIFGTAIVAGGGTGATIFSTHSVLLGEGTSPFGTAGPIATSGIPLVSNGSFADPSFSTAVVAGGGTGITSGTSGGIPYFSSTSTIASSALLGANNPVVGGGAGVAPSTNSSWTFSGGAFSGIAGTGIQVNGLTNEGGGTINANTLYLNNSQFATLANYIQINGGDGNANIFLGYSGDHTNYYRQATHAIQNLAGSTTFATFQAAASGGAQILGTTAADNAPAGDIGEVISNNLLIANEVAITTQTSVTSINVTAGDWDVYGELWVDSSTGAATLTGRIAAGITTTSNTLPTVPADNTARVNVNYTSVPAASTLVEIVSVGPARINVNTTTTVYLVGIANVSAGTSNGYGKIYARRRR